jgi:uncharacterized protein (DUF4415 family)
MTSTKKFRAGRGYTKKEWAAVDSPELTADQIAKGKPFRDAFPDLHASIKRSRGRPKIENPREAVTLRLSPDTVKKFKAAAGKDWRSRMATALDRSKV